MMDIYIDRLNEQDAKSYLHLNAIIEGFSSKRSQAGEMIIIALERLQSGIRNY